jgi:hypothetical protein
LLGERSRQTPHGFEGQRLTRQKNKPGSVVHFKTEMLDTLARFREQIRITEKARGQRGVPANRREDQDPFVPMVRRFSPHYPSH